MRYLFLPSPHVGVFVLSHNAYKVARRPLPFYSPAIPFKYCYFFCRLNQTHFIGMEFRKNLNKCPIQGAHNPDNVYNLTHFRSFILRFLNETSRKNSSSNIGSGPQRQSMDWVHEGVHGLGPQGQSMDQGCMFCICPRFISFQFANPVFMHFYFLLADL